MARTKVNYCTNCGYFESDLRNYETCPVCNAESAYFSKYDSKLERWVTKSVQGNLSYPDPQGTDWAHPNSSLSRHVRNAIWNATHSTKSKR